MANAKMVDDTTAIVTWPVDVWFNGSRTFEAALDFGGRPITAITLDPTAASRIAIRATTSGRRPPPAPRTAKAAPAAATDRSWKTRGFCARLRQDYGGARSDVHDIEDVAVRILEPGRPQVPSDVNVALPCHTRQIVVLELDALRFQVAHDVIHAVADVP